MILINLKIKNAKTPEIAGFTIHVSIILVNDATSIGVEVNIHQPIIEPTIDWDTEIGKPFLRNTNTVNPEARDTVKAPARALTSPSSLIVCEVPPPPITAPMIIKMLVRIAANLNLSIFVVTAVPKILEASLAPNDQPTNNPLVK